MISVDIEMDFLALLGQKRDHVVNVLECFITASADLMQNLLHPCCAGFEWTSDDHIVWPRDIRIDAIRFALIRASAEKKLKTIHACDVTDLLEAGAASVLFQLLPHKRAIFCVVFDKKPVLLIRQVLQKACSMDTAALLSQKAVKTRLPNVSPDA